MRPLGKRQVSFDRPADRGEGAGVEASASGADSQRPASEMRTEAVPFPQFVAAPGQPTMTTWEDASGEPIFGEFDFMCDRLWIDDADVEEPIEFTRTEWVAVRRTKSWRSEDRPVCPSCHGEGETPSGAACGRCLGDGFFAEPIEEVVSDERWLVESGRDHAASAPLSELVAVNIAGDIEAVADRIDRAHETLSAQVEGDASTRFEIESAIADLRRIAAGIRGTLGEEDQ